MVTASSLLEFKEYLDKALRHRVWVLRGPEWSQGLDLMVLVGSFQLGPFCGSVTL